MTSEIRSSTLKNRVGLGTVSFTNTGPVVSGIVTANSFSGTGDLDIDGHTELDNTNIVGIVTVTNVSSGIGLKLIDSSSKQFFAGGGGGGTPFVGSFTGHDFRIQVGGNQNAIFKYAAGARGNFELGPSSGIGITFNGATGNAGYAGVVTATTFSGNIQGGSVTGTTGTFSDTVYITDNIQHVGDSNTQIRFPGNDAISFETAGDQRLRIYDDGYVIIGSTSRSGTVGAGGLDIQGNSTNCILEMGNPFPSFSGAVVPEFRITATNSGHTVDFESVYGGDNLLYKHLSFAGGVTSIHKGINNDEVARFTSSGVGVGTATIGRGPLELSRSDTADVQIHMTNAKTGGGTGKGFTIFGCNASAGDAGFVNRHAGGAIEFYTNQSGTLTEKLRINSNGDVTTTGQVSFNRQNAGFTARSGDSVSITRASGTPLEINRTGSDGQMIGLLDDNSYEAAIGLSGGSLVFGLPNASTPRLTISSTGHAEMAGDLKTGNLSGRNIIINGDMRVAQRATSKSVSNHGNTYDVCDRWLYNRNGVTATLARVEEVPAGSGFKYSLKLTTTSAVGSISAGNMISFAYAIEGQDIRRLGYGSSGAKKATLSFWVRGSLSGKIGVNCSRDSRTFSANEDIVANTWKFVEIVIPADTSTALSADDTANGFNLAIRFAAGSNFTSGPTGGSWINFHTAYAAGFTAGQQGAYLTTNGSTMQVTGVQLEIGSQSTPFEHRPISEELLRCQRYFKRMRGAVGGGGGYGSAGDGAVCTMANWTNTGAYGLLPLGVEMRYAPQLTGFANLNYFSAGNTWAPGSSSQCYLAGSSYDRVELTLQGMSNMSQGNAGWLRIDNTNGYMDFDAEL